MWIQTRSENLEEASTLAIVPDIYKMIRIRYTLAHNNTYIFTRRTDVKLIEEYGNFRDSTDLATDGMFRRL